MENLCCQKTVLHYMSNPQESYTYFHGFIVQQWIPLLHVWAPGRDKSLGQSFLTWHSSKFWLVYSQHIWNCPRYNLKQKEQYTPSTIQRGLVYLVSVHFFSCFFFQNLLYVWFYFRYFNNWQNVCVCVWFVDHDALHFWNKGKWMGEYLKNKKYNKWYF